MNPVLRNVVAVIAGIIVGSLVNYLFVFIGGYLIPLPEGVDNTTVEDLKEAMKHFGPQHFLFPFLAHASGTFAGALLTAYMSATRKFTMAIIIGLFFLAGGIFSVLSMPSPLWFNIVDLVLAYIPMAYLAAYIAPVKITSKKTRKYFVQ